MERKSNKVIINAIKRNGNKNKCIINVVKLKEKIKESE